MFGRRARFGAIVPSNNTTVEPEFAAMAPPGVETFSTRVMVHETDDPAQKVGTILAMHGRIDDAADEVASVGADVIGYACTSGSFLDGDRSDRVVCERLSSRTGVPTVTASTAVVVALRTLGVRRVALATPYIAPVGDGAQRYLEATGFEVVARRDLDLLSNLAKGRLQPEASRDLVRGMDLHGAEAVFVSCTNWRTVEAAHELEAELEVPVISSNIATFWLMLAVAGQLPPTGGTLGDLRLGTATPADIPAFVGA